MLPCDRRGGCHPGFGRERSVARRGPVVSARLVGPGCAAPALHAADPDCSRRRTPVARAGGALTEDEDRVEAFAPGAT